MVLFASATMASAQTYCWTNFASGADFAGAYGATVDSDGNIYTASLGSGKLARITSAGVVTILGASVPAPIEIVVSTNTHNLYVSSLSAGVVKVVPPYGAGNTSQIDGSYQSFACAVDSATETVYASDTGNNQIRIIPNGGAGSVLAGSGAAGSTDSTLLGSSFNRPCGIAVVVSGGNTNLYVADRDNNKIRKIDLGGNAVTTLAGGGAACPGDGTGGAAGFLTPTGCTLGPDGNLVIADQDNLTVRKVTLPGAVVTTLGGNCSFGYDNANGCGTAGHFSDIGQCGVASDGTIYVADRANGDIKKGTAPPVVNELDVQIDFTAGASDTASQFTLYASSTIVPASSYAPVSATITQLGPGSFRVVRQAAGSVQFYRIKSSN